MNSMPALSSARRIFWTVDTFDSVDMGDLIGLASIVAHEAGHDLDALGERRTNDGDPGPKAAEMQALRSSGFTPVPFRNWCPSISSSCASSQNGATSGTSSMAHASLARGVADPTRS